MSERTNRREFLGRNSTAVAADAILATGQARGEAKMPTSLCHLGNLATRFGRTLAFDPDREQIVGDDEANALVRREYREHWGTPREV